MPPIPSDFHETFRSILHGIFDKAVEVEGAPKFEPGFSRPVVVAVYADDANQNVAVMVCNMAAAANLGAALALMPPNVAEDCAKRSQLDDALLENFGEVANICAQLISGHRRCRIHLAEVLPKAMAAPAPLKPLMMKSAERVDWRVEVGGYGEGLVSIRFGA